MQCPKPLQQSSRSQKARKVHLRGMGRGGEGVARERGKVRRVRVGGREGAREGREILFTISINDGHFQFVLC